MNISQEKSSDYCSQSSPTNAIEKTSFLLRKEKTCFYLIYSDTDWAYLWARSCRLEIIEERITLSLDFQASLDAKPGSELYNKAANFLKKPEKSIFCRIIDGTVTKKLANALDTLDKPLSALILKTDEAGIFHYSIASMELLKPRLILKDLKFYKTSQS